MKNIGIFYFIGAILSSTLTAKTFENKSTQAARYQDLTRKLNIPVYFGIPKSATSRNVLDNYDTQDELFYLESPDSTNADNPVGLRLYITDRNLGAPQRLVQSGFIQTGDVLVSFRPDWAHSGPYTQGQMGQTHAGLAYVENGILKNVEHPLDINFLLPEGDILGRDPHEDLDPTNIYKHQPMVHIFRPRFLANDPNRVHNFEKWAKLLRGLTRANPAITAATSIFPFRIGFNMDYLNPRYRRGDTDYNWVKNFGQIILGNAAAPRMDLFCSELVWTFLSLSGCDPDNDRADIMSTNRTACIKPAFEPLPMVGDYFSNAANPRGPQTQVGLGEGPLMVIDALKNEARRQEFINSVFADATADASLSAGQKKIVATVQDAFLKMKDYYSGIFESSGANRDLALDRQSHFNMQDGDNGFKKPNGDPLYFLDNYSPTSFGINSYLPDDNDHRAFDYVGTLVFKDSIQE